MNSVSSCCSTDTHIDHSGKAASGGVNFSLSAPCHAMGDLALVDVEPIAQMGVLAERAALNSQE
jgi:hypothetical protein